MRHATARPARELRQVAARDAPSRPRLGALAYALWCRRLGAMGWPERVRALGDECWRAAQLVVFFVVAAFLFSAPPRAGIFTPAVYQASAADQGRPAVVRATLVRPLTEDRAEPAAVR